MQILCVDDEPAILRALVRLLGRFECVATPASSLREIERQIEAIGIFDLAILDLHMPEISGEEVARRVRAARPDLPIVLCSGYVSTLEYPSEGQPYYRVPKPFMATTLAQVLAEVRLRRGEAGRAAVAAAEPGMFAF